MINTIASHSLLIVGIYSLLITYSYASSRKLNLLFLSIVGGLFALHVINFIGENYRVINVFLNSSTNLPILYKFAASWGSHEGSIFLFTTILAIVGRWNLIKKIDDIMKYENFFHYKLISFLYLYIYFFANPFWQFELEDLRVGLGFNPLLQDHGLVYHPPILYLGQALTILGFIKSLAFVELHRRGRVTYDQFARINWYGSTLLATGILTLGIVLGSSWAYRELGWGGFWFWDPVETLSLLPWFSLLLVFHLYLIPYKYKQGFNYAILLNMLPFVSVIFSTFLIRSGLLTSVHSFSPSDDRWIFFSLYLVLNIIIIGYVWYRLEKLKFPIEENTRELFSRLSLLLYSTAILLTIVATIVFVFSFPIILQILTGKIITVGEEFFVNILIPLYLLSLVGTYFAILYRKEQNTLAKILYRERFVLFFVGVFFFILVSVIPNLSILCTFGAFIGVMLITLTFRAKFYHNISHGLMGIILICLAINGQFSSVTEVILNPNRPLNFKNYRITLADIKYEERANYFARKFLVHFESDSGNFSLTPEERLYILEGQKTNEVSIKHFLTHDIYLHLTLINEKDGRVKGKIYQNYATIVLLISSILLAFSFIYSFNRFTKKFRLSR